MNATSPQNPSEGTSTPLTPSPNAAGASNANSPATPLIRQLDGESERAFSAFCAYLELGPRRRYSAVVRKCGSSLRTVKRWANDFNWRSRIAAYAAQGAQQYTDADSTIHHEELMDAAARAKALRERQYVVAEALLDAAERYLENVDSTDLDAMSFSDACKAVEVASRITLQAELKDAAGDSTPSNALRDQLESLLDQAYGDGSAKASRGSVLESPEDFA